MDIALGILCSLIIVLMVGMMIEVVRDVQYSHKRSKEQLEALDKELEELMKLVTQQYLGPPPEVHAEDDFF